jgi:hypothetical protein
MLTCCVLLKTWLKNRQIQLQITKSDSVKVDFPYSQEQAFYNELKWLQ